MINHHGIMPEHERIEDIPKKRKMSWDSFTKDIRDSFNFDAMYAKKGKLDVRGITSGRDPNTKMGYRYEIRDRGRGQKYCLDAHFRCWYFTGTTENYCEHCHHFQIETTLMDQGITKTCGKGFWHQEAN